MPWRAVWRILGIGVTVSHMFSSIILGVKTEHRLLGVWQMWKNEDKARGYYNNSGKGRYCLDQGDSSGVKNK